MDILNVDNDKCNMIENQGKGECLLFWVKYFKDNLSNLNDIK